MERISGTFCVERNESTYQDGFVAKAFCTFLIKAGAIAKNARFGSSGQGKFTKKEKKKRTTDKWRCSASQAGIERRAMTAAPWAGKHPITGRLCMAVTRSRRPTCRRGTVRVARYVARDSIGCNALLLMLASPSQPWFDMLTFSSCDSSRPLLNFKRNAHPLA
jgi:hypothetical protein